MVLKSLQTTEIWIWWKFVYLFCYWNIFILVFSDIEFGHHVVWFFFLAHAPDVQSHVLLPWKESHPQRYQAGKSVDGTDWRAQDCWLWLVCACTFIKVRITRIETSHNILRRLISTVNTQTLDIHFSCNRQQGGVKLLFKWIFKVWLINIY